MTVKNIEHMALIIDGNRRWAHQKGLSLYEAYNISVNNLKNIAIFCAENNLVNVLTLYAFSTENWQRSSEEVILLMEILKQCIIDIENDHGFKDIEIKFIGNRNNLSADILQAIYFVESKVVKNKKLSLYIALDYGGRSEIVNAVKQITKANYNDLEIDEQLIEKFLYTNCPHPDILIRSGGNHRISNFLLWQLAYTEIFFVDKMWPEFTIQDFLDVIKQYKLRDRRYGK